MSFSWMAARSPSTVRPPRCWCGRATRAPAFFSAAFMAPPPRSARPAESFPARAKTQRRFADGGLLSALRSRWLTTRHMGENAANRSLVTVTSPAPRLDAARQNHLCEHDAVDATLFRTGFAVIGAIHCNDQIECGNTNSLCPPQPIPLVRPVFTDRLRIPPFPPHPSL